MPKKTANQPGTDFPGDLKYPIYVELTKGIGVWGTKPRTPAEIAEEASKQVAKKFEALMRHYGIRANSSEKWQQLSLCLAQELGLMDITFERPRGAGAPPIWLAAEAELVKRMDETIGNKEMSAEEAAKILIKKHPDEYGRLKPKSLVNRRDEAKKRLRERPGVSLSVSSLKQHWLAGRRLRGLPNK
jgi:hypothetical protein